MELEEPRDTVRTSERELSRFADSRDEARALRVAAMADEQFSRRFALGPLLGRGGMSVVFSATRRGPGQEVAVKLLRAAHDPVMVRLFEREAELLMGIVAARVIRAFEYDLLECGTPYLVLELVRGENLQALVRRVGPQPPEVVRTIGVALCRVLQEVHALGIVHRDVKPANVMMDWSADGASGVTLVDFGVALARSRRVEARIEPAMLVGSPAFSAPEQLEDARHVDERTDIWSLGATLHYLMTAKYPHESSSVATMIAARLDGSADRTALDEASVPAPLTAAIMRCLARAPADRPSDVRSLRALLEARLPEPADAAATEIARGR